MQLNWRHLPDVGPTVTPHFLNLVIPVTSYNPESITMLKVVLCLLATVFITDTVLKIQRVEIYW